MANANDLQKTLAEDANLTKKQRESMLRSSLAFILSDLRGDQSQTEPKKEELKELPLVTDVKCHMVSETIDTAETNLQEALSDPVEIVEEIQPTPTTSQASFDSFELLLTCDEPFRQGNFNNFLKGCKWSPDGTCILTASEDRHARVFTLPADLYNGKYSLSVSENLAVLSSARHGDLIYDYHWYPLMNSQSYDTCVYVTASKDSPVHMWDATTGETRCTYRPKNHLDELAMTYSVGFSLDGVRLYCGANKCFRVFDVNRPGTKCDSRPTVAKGQSGQTGIISCFAMSPETDGVFAVGSYGRTVGLYSEEMAGALWLIQGQSGGVTHLQFSPDGQRLYTGGRKDPEILCWDMRHPGRVLMTLQRPLDTNQRLYFDQDRVGRHLISGCSEGKVLLWNTTAIPVENSSEATIEPIRIVSAHSSVVSGASLNPVLPLVATASGQRVFARVDIDSSDEDDLEVKVPPVDNSLKIWFVGNSVF